LSQQRRTNKLGQQIRQRGSVTRNGLMAAARRLLEIRSPLMLTVHGIAREAGSSPATFYVYFSDVPDVLLALCETTREGTARILRTLDGPWPAKDIPARVSKFVKAYRAFWDEHRRLLAVRNLESDLGDERFANERIRAGAPLVDALAERIREARGPRHVTYQEAWAESLITFASMEQLFAYSPRAYRRPETPINRNHVFRAEIEIICRLLDPSTR